MIPWNHDVILVFAVHSLLFSGARKTFVGGGCEEVGRDEKTGREHFFLGKVRDGR